MTAPDSVRFGWVWEPYAEAGPSLLPYAQWIEDGRIVYAIWDAGIVECHR